MVRRFERREPVSAPAPIWNVCDHRLPVLDDLGVYRDGFWVLQAVRATENAERQQFLGRLLRGVQGAGTLSNFLAIQAHVKGRALPAIDAV